MVKKEYIFLTDLSILEKKKILELSIEEKKDKLKKIIRKNPNWYDKITLDNKKLFIGFMTDNLFNEEEGLFILLVLLH